MRRRVGGRRPLAVAALTLAACGATDARAQSPNATVRDSAGVTIVESRAPAWAEGEGWTIADTPSVRIGAIDGPPEMQLYDVIGAARLRDGAIVIANAGTQELRVYDARGRHLRSVGREGAGPGEFRLPTWFRRLRGDSLLVYDLGLHRLSVFTPDLRFARTFALDNVGGSMRPEAPLSGARLVGSVSRNRGPRGERRSGVPDIVKTLLIFSMDGAVLDTIGTFPDSEGYIRVDPNGRRTLIPPGFYPFGRSIVGASHGDRFFLGWTGRYEIRGYGAEGELERIVRRAHEHRQITERDVERARAEFLRGASSENARRRQERLFADLELHETMPAFETFVADTEGHLWVRPTPRPAEETGAAGWDVFDPRGRWLGVVRLPAGLEVYEIGPDYVLGKMLDELDVQRVVLFPLDRSGG